MNIKHLLVVALATIALSSSAADIVPDDPTVRHGVLPNGLTYYVKQNNYPEHHADFFIAQRVGSIQEEASQRGLAHFLEHMCFNGTKHFPGNSLISYMESIGVKFGANLNAYTSTDETVYNISNVPTARLSALDSCLLVLSDWSHDLLLHGKDIDQERGVIEGEWRHRTAANNRMLERALPELYPGNLYGRRMPIGTMDVVKNFKHKELRNYYKKWYHPSNQCIIVVGDIDPDWVVERIIALFGKAKNPKNAVPVTPVEVPDNEQIIATVQSDVEQPSTSVRLLFKHGSLMAEQMATTDFFRNDYLTFLVSNMLSSRFADLKQQSDAPFTHVGVADRQYILSKTRDALQFNAISKSGMAELTMQWMAREVNRATTYGFTEGELRRARLTYQAALDRLTRERDKYANTRYARDFVRAYLQGEPIPSIDENNRIMQRIIDEVTLDDVNNQLRSLVSPTDRNVVLMTFAPDKQGVALPTRQSLVDAFHQGRAMQVEPYVDTLRADRLLAVVPAPGKIVAECDVPQFGARQWTLSNGMRVLVKKTDIKPGEMVIAGAGPGGLSQNYRPEDAPSFKAFAGIVATMGFGQFTASELKKVLAGKDVSMRTFVSKTEEGFQGATTRRDLETAMQLLYLRLTMPQKDERAFQAYLENLRSSLVNRAADPKFEFADSIFAGVWNHHPLGGERLSEAEIDRTSVDRVLEVYKDRFADVSDITAYIIGDFDEDSLRIMTERYLAALPGNGRIEQPRDIGYRLFSGKVFNHWTRKMENPQDKVYYFWTGDCPYTLRTTLLARVCSQVFKDMFRDEIREKRGWTYHVDTHCSVTADNNGQDGPVIFMPLNVTVTAGKAAETRQVIEQVMAGVAEHGITDQQLNKAKQYLRKVYDEDRDDNTYWMDIMRRYTKFGIDLDKGYIETLNSLTTDDVRDFVRQHIDTGNRLILTMEAN